MSHHPISRILIVAALLLAGSGCFRSKNTSAAYETAPVTKGDITQIVTASGTLSALVSVDVGSQISGRIQTLNADFNSQVKKGDLIAQIEPTIYQAIVDQSEGELANAQAVLQLARLTATRKTELVAKNAGPQADLDKANAEFLQAKASVTIQQAQLEKAKADLSHCQIQAPVDGIVISRKVDVGQTVAATMTTPVLYVIAQDITKMHIVATVSEADIGQVAVGQAADFGVDAFPDEVFHGQVSQVRRAATTTNNVVTYDTVIDVANPEQKLFPGMTANVSITVSERRGVLTVPNAALRFAPPENAKFAAQDADVKLARNARTVYLPTGDGSVLKVAAVKIGSTDGINSEITSGLSASDHVVTAQTDPAKKGGFPPPPNP